MSKDKLLFIIGSIMVMFSPMIVVIAVWCATFGSFDLMNAFVHANIDSNGSPTGTYHPDEAGLAFSGLMFIVGICMLFTALASDD